MLYFLKKIPQIKEREKVFYQPSTNQVFLCLADMPEYSKILAARNPNKPYKDFLRWLINFNFYVDEELRISIKRIATDFKLDKVKVSKWIKEI